MTKDANTVNLNEMLDHVWALFENQDATVSESILDSIEFFHLKYNFNISVLPYVLFDAYTLRLEERERCDSEENKAEDKIWSSLPVGGE